MQIHEAAARSGLSADTIRYYEKSGMLPKIPKDKSGWRHFDAGAMEWLITLERLRSTGMPLKEVRRFAVLVHNDQSETPEAIYERLDILCRHAERLKRRRTELDACEAYLAKKISIYSAQKEQAE
ncbi:MAG: MerR family transcriptional regulator [Rhizobiaceae bacterium]